LPCREPSVAAVVSSKWLARPCCELRLQSARTAQHRNASPRNLCTASRCNRSHHNAAYSIAVAASHHDTMRPLSHLRDTRDVDIDLGRSSHNIPVINTVGRPWGIGVSWSCAIDEGCAGRAVVGTHADSTDNRPTTSPAAQLPMLERMGFLLRANQQVIRKACARER
jgi:hypothetical protein